MKSISVARRPDGRYMAYDGNHTLSMAALAGIDEVPCLVIPSTGAAEESIAFGLINTNRRNQTAAGKHMAKVVGCDQSALDINQMLADLGVTLSDKKTDTNTLSCIGVLNNAYIRYGNSVDTLKMTLAFLMTVFPSDNNRLQADMIHGACSFTNQVINSGGNVTAAWSSVKSSKKTCGEIILSAGAKKNASLAKGASRKSFVTASLFEVAKLA